MEITVCEATRMLVHVGEIAKRLRQNRGWSIEELAERANVNKGTVVGLERGRPFRSDTLQRIASALGTTDRAMYTVLTEIESGAEEFAIDRLLWKQEVAVRRTTAESDVEPGTIDVSDYKPDDIPVIAEGEATPKDNLFWDDEGKLAKDVEDRVSRPSDVTDPRAYALSVRGDSMVPVYKPGMIVIVSPNLPWADGDDCYVELLSGERLLKTVHRSGTGYSLESRNPAYSLRFVQPEEVGTIHVIVWARKKRRGPRTTGPDGRRM